MKAGKRPARVDLIPAQAAVSLTSVESSLLINSPVLSLRRSCDFAQRQMPFRQYNQISKKGELR